MERPSSSWGLDLDLRRFPRIECLIGYGSGVFRQVGYSGTRPMVDLVFVIKESATEAWHAENLRAQPEHYSRPLRVLGPAAVARLQHWGPGLYYNPHVQLATASGEELEAKYGVVSTEALLRDLTQWDALYMAGRMHKPCLLQRHLCDDELHASFVAAVEANRRAALCAALLLAGNGGGHRAGELGLLPLLTTLVRLSYDGDVRVGLAEDPQKVSNIVHGQQRDLWDIYSPIAENLGVSFVHRNEGPSLASTVARFDIGGEARRRLFGELPGSIRERVVSRCRGGPSPPWDAAGALRGELRAAVRRSSLAQTAKGALTAGAARGTRYVLEKLRKRLR